MSLDFINEAFRKLELLNEDTFDTSLDGINKLSNFMKDDIEDTVSIIDTEAETEEDLEDSYVGKIIVNCNVCHSHIFRNQEDISIDEEGVVNIEDVCPYCGEQNGFVIVGKIEDFDEEDIEDNGESDDDTTDTATSDDGVGEVNESKKISIDRSKLKKLRESASLKMGEGIKNPRETSDKVERNLLKSQDSDLVRDLTLCIENDGEVYRRFTTPVIQNLRKKYAKGTFDEKLAVQAFYNVVLNALKMPHFARDYSYDIGTTPVPERYAVAQNLLSGAMDEITYENKVNESATDVTDQVVIKTSEDGFLTKKKDLEKQGYKVIGTGNGQIIMAKPKELTESPYYLDTKYDSRKSFYNKAMVSDNTDELYSYGIKVMEIRDGKPVITCREDQLSQTTLRHIKEFLKQKGFDAISKQQIIRDYAPKTECMKESLRDSEHRDVVLDYFGYSTSDDFLDLVADLLDRVEDFSNEQEIWEAIDNGMIYTKDQWTAYMHYCDIGDPADKMWENLYGDLISLCGKISDNEITDIDESLKQSMLEKLSKRLIEGINNATVETDNAKLTMTADENGKVTVSTEPIDNSDNVDGEAVAPLDDSAMDAIIDDSATNVEDDVSEEEEISLDIEEIDEEDFDDLGESYLKKVYENVDSFKTTKVSNSDTKLVVEGVIKFKSGNSKKTGFVFESHSATRDGKVNFLGENKHLSSNKNIFTLKGRVSDKKLVLESLSYDYPVGKANNKVKGEIIRSK